MKAVDVQKKISQWAMKNGYQYNKLISMSKSGWPDCMVVIDGTTYFFEVKVGDDKQSPLQKHKIEMLNKDSKIAYVIKNYKEFLDIVSKLVTIW